MTSLHISWAFLAIISLHAVLASTIQKRQTSDIAELDPIQEALSNSQAHMLQEEQPHGDRDKRLAVIKSIGIKAILLNLIFGKIDGVLDHKIRIINQLDKQNVIKNEKYFGITTPRPTKPGRPGSGATTPAAIEFSTSSPVSLVIPDRLYGNSFGLVTNISQTIGDVLFNTADRAQEFSDRISSKIRRQFGFATNLLGSATSKSSAAASAKS